MKNNKKGFTLVELLAVIAILAILVIIALPNVLELFTQARENAFITEVREVFKQAQTQFVTDSMSMGAAASKVYSSDAADNKNKLQLTGGSGGNDKFSYCIRVNTNGQAVSLKVSNGTYVYTLGVADSLTPLSDGSKIEKDSTHLENTSGVTVAASDCPETAS